MAEQQDEPTPSSWVAMSTRVRPIWPSTELYQDLVQVLPAQQEVTKQETPDTLKLQCLQCVIRHDDYAWHLACSCPEEMFDYVLRHMLRELACRYREDCGQRLQYSLTRSVVRLSLHCVARSLSLLSFLRSTTQLFHPGWFRWDSGGHQASEAVTAMWAFYAELADALAVGYVVPRLYARPSPTLPTLDLSGIPRLRDSTWSLQSLCDAAARAFGDLQGRALRLTLDVEVEGHDEPALRLLHRLATERRGETDTEGFVVGVRQLHISCLAGVLWGSLLEDLSAFPELEHVTLSTCDSTVEDVISLGSVIGPQLTGLALPGNPGLSLDCLERFTALITLDLSNIDLRDSIEPICCLPTPLHFLSLSGCRLADADMHLLAGSRHAPTLRQLDVSDNSCRADTEVLAACVGLVSTLAEVSVLNLSNCGVVDCEDSSVASVREALSSLANLKILAVSCKDLQSNQWLVAVLEGVGARLYRTA